MAFSAACVLLLAACGGDQRELSGYSREPLPEVGSISLPDATNDSEPFALRADPGGLLILYFGYTNCPDFCPTTMSDVKLARARLDDPERISVAMVTVDPERDFVVDPERCEDQIVLACYVTSFVDDAHALGTQDASLLSAAAAPFGVVYEITKNGDSVDVGHTTSLYAIDDQGRLALTWQFGVAIDDLAADMEQLLRGADA